VSPDIETEQLAAADSTCGGGWQRRPFVQSSDDTEAVGGLDASVSSEIATEIAALLQTLYHLNSAAL
jgi:hypothetical protein